MENKDLTLDEFERLVYTRQYEQATQMLIAIVSNIIEQGTGVTKDDGTPLDDHMAFAFYTRFASAITALIVDPHFSISPVGFCHLMVHQPALAAALESSAFEGPDHILRVIGKQNQHGQFSLEGEQAVMKFLTAYSLYTATNIDIGTLLKTAPSIALSSYLSLLSPRMVLTQQAEAKRTELLNMAGLLENISISFDVQSVQLLTTWMYCSYALQEEKHHVKKYLNKMLQEWMQQKGVKAPHIPKKRVLKKRPTILLPLEIFTSIHAMYRCYAPAIEQLKEKFKLVAMVETGKIDDKAKELFDQVIEINYHPDELKQLIGKIIKLKPDIIYYPSLGMAAWTVLTANLRLAPIQLYTLGHPATTNSQFIDYLFLEDIYFGNADCFSEKVIVLPNGTLQFVSLPKQINIPANIRKQPDTIKIAIASRSFKINAQFIAVCKEIEKRSTRPIEFHFFPNERGLVFYYIKREILNELPDAIVYPSSSYTSYIENLNQCDIHFQTFPFGGSNSNADSITQGLPMVTLESNEPHSRTDLPFIKFTGMPEWLVSQNEEEYIQAALRLINDDEERIQLSEQLLGIDLEDIIFDAEYKKHPKHFCDAMWWLYSEHDSLKNSSEQSFVFDNN